MEKLDGRSMNLKKHSIEKIKELFPEVVTEGKVDFDELRLILGDEVDESNEKYQFTWNGKSQTIKLAQKPSNATLRPSKEESKNWDTTENLYIEGDNLEVLKQLQKTYFGKIKIIYIDPPYNTGGEFVYKDDFKDSIKNYKEQTNQTSRSNADTSGRYHTDWLNMMYSRLMLAKNLLREDGAIFVSIDYNEFANLKKVMDEIFGEQNFQREIIWRIGWLSGYKTIAPNFIRNHDTIFMYSKNPSEFKFNKKYIMNKDFKSIVKLDSNFRQKLNDLGLDVKKQAELVEFINHTNRPEKYPIEDTWNSNEYDDLNSIAIVSFSGEKVSKILNINEDFKGQKSIAMLKRLIDATTDTDSIVLDFFSGSASTAHAVLAKNFEDGGNRKFIMVQLPEKINPETDSYKKGFKNLCDIAKERIRLSGNKLLGLNDSKKNHTYIDIGFKVFKLDDTNIKEWDSSLEVSESTLFDQKEVFKEDRTEEDVLYEILLKYGVFDMPVREVNILHKKAYDIGQGDMVVALFDDITAEDVRAIGDLKPRVVIFKDSGFKDDNVKLNALHNLQRQGVEDVKSI